MRPETSIPAWMKRKILSMSKSTSRCSSSRKYSAIVSAACPRGIGCREARSSERKPSPCSAEPRPPSSRCKVPAFATTLANPAKDTDSLVMPDHVVNHFSEQDRLAHSRATEESRLAASSRADQYVDYLDSRLKDLQISSSDGPKAAARYARHAIQHPRAGLHGRWCFRKHRTCARVWLLPTGA